MPVSIKLFDWQQPLLPQVAAFLVDEYEQPERVDLRDVVCVLPGRRAIRRFTELLVQEADRREKAVISPQMIPQGVLPETICNALSNYGSPFALKALWFEVLRREPAAVRTLHPRYVDDPGLLAHTLNRLWDGVGREGLTFSEIASRLENFSEAASVLERWKTLAQLEAQYKQLAKEYDLNDRTLSRADLLNEVFPKDSRKFLLIGTIDLAGEAQQFVRQTKADVLSCIAAENTDGFSDIGTLNHRYWEEQWRSGGGLTPSSITVLDDPLSEAAEIASRVVQLATSELAQDITVGVADEDFAPYLTQVLSACDVPFHSGLELAPEARTLVLFFQQLSVLLKERTFSAAALLLQSPLAVTLLQIAPEAKIKQCFDRLGEASVPHIIFPLSEFRLPALGPEIRDAFGKIDALHTRFSEPRKPLEWYDLLIELSSSEQETFNAVLELWVETYGDQENGLELSLSGVECCESLAETAATMRGRIGSDSAGEVGVEVIGWLELLLDDSPHVLVMGMHDGALPGGKPEDIWLPQSARQYLGLEDEVRRVGRDLYLLNSLCASRKTLHCTLPRKNPKGDFLRPSRLCIGGQPSDALEVIKTGFLEAPVKRRVKLFGEQFGNGSPWICPEPSTLPTGTDELSVTALGNYLACPYRFYLKHIVRLGAEEGLPEELQARPYGTLTHDVLQAFGESKARNSTSADEIAECLIGVLSGLAAKRFGNIAKPAVAVQLHYLRTRLRAFAESQAEWRALGWTIEQTEFPLPKREISIEHEAGKTFLKGRIDRIDRHQKTGQVVAFDYKTSNRVTSPEKAHYQADEWVNLQLPLYREALLQLSYAEDLQTGYIHLPASSDKTAFSIATWTAEEYEDAMGAAQEVAVGVMRGEFWPPSEHVLFDDFQDLLGHGQYEALEVLEEGDR